MPVLFQRVEPWPSIRWWRYATNKRALRYLFFFAASIFLSACGGESEDPLEQTISANYQLPLAGALSVHDEDGSIQIYCADHPGLQMVATKRAYSAERLAAIQIRVTAHNNAISIDTIVPPKKKWSWSDRSGVVNYNLVVPWDTRIENLDLNNGEISVKGLRGGSARARLTNGRIAAVDCFSPLDFRALNGNIDFYYDWWEKQIYLVRATITNGGIGLVVPKIASFRLRAKMNNGGLLSELVDEKNRGESESDIETVVGETPGPTFQFTTESGNVRIDGY